MNQYQERIPQITSIETAIEIYYSKTQLGNADIKKLFGVSSSKVTSLKKIVRQAMAERNVMPYNALLVNTKIAYEVWGLDIADLEKRHIALERLRKRMSS